MRVPDVLWSLIDQGIIDDVVRPLKSGKEAQVFLVRADGEARVAKVYKDAQERSFKQRAQYTEGRRTRNTRDQRAMQRRTRHGKAQEESAWKSSEVNIIYRLHAQGVRVPTPYNFIDGVLIMELVRGEDGDPAPRLSEVALDPRSARAVFDQLLREVVKMLCAGIVHGDLSDYNVLLDTAGPVVIDFPQSVDAAQNRNARRLLVRDVDNLSAFLARVVPGARRKPFGQEIWAAYEDNRLTPDLELSGRFRRSTKATNMGALLDEIEDAEKDEQRRREKLGQAGPRPRKREVIITPSGGPKGRGGGGPRKRGSRGGSQEQRGGRGGAPQEARADDRRPEREASGEGAPKRRRRRRRRGGGGGSGAGDQGGQGARRQEGGGATQHAQSSRKPGSKEASSNGASGNRGARNQASDPDKSAGAAKPRRRRRRRRRGGGGGSSGGGAPSGQNPPPRDGGDR